MAQQIGIGKLVDPYWKARFKYAKYLKKAPLEEKAVLFESQHGEEFNGTVFYILKYMAHSEEYKGFKFYLAAVSERIEDFKDKLREYKIKGVTVVDTKDEHYFKALASCKYLVNDDTFLSFFIKREGQVYLNTWHGTPLKTLGCKVKADAYNIGNEQKNFICADYLLFQNDYAKDMICRDYFLENLARGKAVVAGYPRNTIFFDPERAEEVRRKLAPNGEKIYAYMPTHRGGTSAGSTAKATAFFVYYLYELDEKLEDGEILYTKIHPVAQNDISFEDFKHIKPFPARLETYDVLNACDLLVTDYSSVVFDYICTKKKVVLYVYDREEYLKDRGTYMPLEELPFPQVCTTEELVKELRSGKEYNDDALREKFCPFDNPEASKKLMDRVVLKKETGLKLEDIPDNGKENVFLYAGNLAANGMTASLRTLLKNLDNEKRNYYISFWTEAAAVNKDILATFKGQTGYFGTLGDMTLTWWQGVLRKLFKDKYIKAGLYMFFMKKVFRNNFLRQFGGARIDRLVQFTGYEAETILAYSAFKGHTSIFVHNDMLGEIKLKGNQRKDVLKYAYRHYNKVAVVTDDILPPTRKLAGRRANIVRV
ncbi:MAG: CDP-glycerol glycerophosphotransferase family protein, partial [Lachnospiraceae bacterium]|nr:CDP-glycerol glycerophosphotransferase family protein [Lachnospiraceae bacterium]